MPCLTPVDHLQDLMATTQASHGIVPIGEKMVVPITLVNGDMKDNESCMNLQHSLGTSIIGPLILLGTDGTVMTRTTKGVIYRLETSGKFMSVNHFTRKKN